MVLMCTPSSTFFIFDVGVVLCSLDDPLLLTYYEESIFLVSAITLPGGGLAAYVGC